MPDLQSLVLLGAFVLTVLFVIDWRQTLNIVRSGGRWYERNPMLVWFLKRSSDPVPTVHCWFGFVAFISVPVFAVLWRESQFAAIVLLSAFILAEAWCVLNNRRLGIPFLTTTKETS